MWFEHSSASWWRIAAYAAEKMPFWSFPQESGYGPWECTGLLGLWCCSTDGGSGWTWRSLPTAMILWSKGLNLNSTPRARGFSPLLLSDSGAPTWVEFPVLLNPLFALLFSPIPTSPLSPPVVFGKIFTQGSVCYRLVPLEAPSNQNCC